MYPREWCISRGVLCQAEARGLSRTLLTEIQFNNGWVSVINSHKAEREISFYTDLWLYFPSTKPQGHQRMSHPEEGGVVTDGGDMVSEPGRGGLKAAMVLLQGGSTLIIRRPQVAKFIFICAARRKFFPERNIMNYETKILDLLTYKRSLSYKTSCKFQNSKRSC